MMPSGYVLRVPDSLVAQIRGMHPALKKKVRSGLDCIVNNPEAGKSLKLELQGLRSFRVGRFRIIYRSCPDGIVELVAIGPRGTIYEETLRIVMRDKDR